MSPDLQFDEARVRKSSRHSAWITLFGALVVGIAFLYSLLKLNDINQEYQTKQALANAAQQKADSPHSTSDALSRGAGARVGRAPRQCAGRRPPQTGCQR